IGVLRFKGANMMGMDQDDILLSPWRTLKSKGAGTPATTANQSAPGQQDPPPQGNLTKQAYPHTPTNTPPAPTHNPARHKPPPLLPVNVDQILVRVATEQEIKQAINEISAVLRERHHIRAGQSDDFNLRDMTEISKAMGSTSQLMSALLLVVAFISL